MQHCADIHLAGLGFPCTCTEKHARTQIAETQRALLAARAEEARSAAAGPAGPEVTRWMALKSVAEARTMLQTLYRAAVEQRAQVPPRVQLWHSCGAVRLCQARLTCL